MPKSSDTTASTPKSVTEFLRANPEFAKLTKLMGLSPNQLMFDHVDGYPVVEGRFTQTSTLAQKIYQAYQYPENRDMVVAKEKAMRQDMEEGNWSNLADPGYLFAMDEDGVLVMADGHHRNWIAKDSPILDKKPLRTRVLMTTVPVEQVYIKMDRGTAKNIATRNKAGKFHERLGVEPEDCGDLFHLAVAVECDGGSRSSVDEKVMFDRDETRFAEMNRVRDIFVRFRNLCSSRDKMKVALKAADYAGMFDADSRWDILNYRSFSAAIARTMLDNPDMADVIFGFAEKLLTFDTSNECQNLTTLSQLLRRFDNKRLSGGVGYKLGFNVVLMCLCDYLNGRKTDLDMLMAVMAANKAIRTKTMTNWTPRQAQTLHFVEEKQTVVIGKYEKIIPMQYEVKKSGKLVTA
jgi:hypothetical protein